MNTIRIAGRDYVEVQTYRWDARLKRRVVSGTRLQRRWPKVRGKSAVKRAKRTRLAGRAS